MHLYKLDFPNGKSYIGITSYTAEKRFKQHCKQSSNSLIAKAIRKYGKDAVVLTVLDNCSDWDSLCKMEISSIKFYNTKIPNGYNLTDGGDGTLGAKHSLESRARRSAASMGKIRYIASDETRKKIGDSSRGRVQSKEARNKISEAMKNRVVSDETRLKLSIANKGKTLTEEQKLKISVAVKSRVISDETRRKLSMAGKGRVMSDESKRKTSIGNKGKVRTAEYKEKMSKAKKGKKLTTAKRGRAVSQHSKDTSITDVINTYISISEASRSTGIDTGNIFRACNVDGASAGGYRWRYINV